MSTDRDWAELNETRVVFYRWLSGLFAREISVEDIDSYRDGDGSAMLEDLSADPVMKDAVDQMRGVLGTEQSNVDLRIELAGRFAALFLGAGGRKTAPPYESHYTNEKGLLFQEATHKMDTYLERYDVHVDESFKEPADHIAIQLELMAVLAGHAAAGDPNSKDVRDLVEAQAEVLDSQLLNWVPQFAADCQSHDTSGFYAGIASVLNAFLSTDRASCGIWLENN